MALFIECNNVSAPRQSARQRGFDIVHRLRAHELDSFANNRFRQRQAVFQRIDLIRRPLHDDAAQHVSFLRYADGGVGGNLVLKTEPENQMIERRLAQILVDEGDGSDDRRAGEGDGGHVRPGSS